MSWGVFTVYRTAGSYPEPPLVHVAPCAKDGTLKEGHRLTDDCPCGVRMVPGEGPLDPAVRSHYDPRHLGTAYPLQA